MPSRDQSVDTIQREMTAFARRARAAAARMHPELSLVSFTLLSHLEDQQGCRATDLAAYYMLDKSTISRQIASLERLGFIERRTDPADHRIQLLHLTPAGTEKLAEAAVLRRHAFHERLAEWEAADLKQFAAYLLKYNSTSA
ncbi:MarR family winged helix-turn-helix transcriptional regulator [Streptomyces sp. NPDC059070]|uniref:MarR family winged helix-turn-helix transcriptional regulator n=1 Tax=unclassified Streptomyces TaxID=2593676 RepID=UPI0034E1FADE